RSPVWMSEGFAPTAIDKGLDSAIMPMALWFRKTSTLLPPLLETATSLFPSPSKSATDTPEGELPAGTSVLSVNEIYPDVQVLRRMDIVPENEFTVIRS